MMRPDPIVLAVGPCFGSESDALTVRQALARERMSLTRVRDQHAASIHVCEADPVVVVIDLSLTQGSPLAVADFCNYRRPRTPVILLGAGQLMADGSLFRHVGNAAALLPAQTRASDLVSLIAFHADHRLPLT